MFPEAYRSAFDSDQQVDDFIATNFTPSAIRAGSGSRLVFDRTCTRHRGGVHQNETVAAAGSKTGRAGIPEDVVDVVRRVGEAVDRDGATTVLIETELRRELYLRAAEIVKVEFRPDSWQAFEMSVAGDLEIEEVAERLGKSVGAIYTARSRIMFRLREVISELGEHSQ